jgi:D-alanine-D-alanine ligase
MDNRSRLEIPAVLDAEVAEAVRRQSLLAFEAIDGSGLARVDFLLSRSTGELFINEINTLPGFTTISMYAKLWAASGVDYATLVDRLIALAVQRHAAKQELKTSTF